MINLASLFNGISAFMVYLMFSHPCKKTVMILCNSGGRGVKEVHAFSQGYPSESEYNSATGVVTRFLKRCSRPL